MKTKTPPPIDYRLADLDTLAGYIGAHLRAHRRKKKLSGEVLADRAGVSLSTLYKLEKTGHADFATFLRVLRALRLTDLLKVFECHDAQSSPMAALKATSGARARARVTGETSS